MSVLGMTTRKKKKTKKYDIMEEQVKPLISSMVVVKYCSKSV